MTLTRSWETEGEIPESQIFSFTDVESFAITCPTVPNTSARTGDSFSRQDSKSPLPVSISDNSIPRARAFYRPKKKGSRYKRMPPYLNTRTPVCKLAPEHMNHCQEPQSGNLALDDYILFQNEFAHREQAKRRLRRFASSDDTSASKKASAWDSMDASPWDSYSAGQFDFSSTSALYAHGGMRQSCFHARISCALQKMFWRVWPSRRH